MAATSEKSLRKNADIYGIGTFAFSAPVRRSPDEINPA
jgi:hypothetical protein